jgi:hypothetical protein
MAGNGRRFDLHQRRALRISPRDVGPPDGVARNQTGDLVERNRRIER